MLIGVCSDVHSETERLALVLEQMDAAGAAERWCLGDLVAGAPPDRAIADLARRFDLLIAGNHDLWVLGADPRAATFRLRTRSFASRHGIDCWHGSPRHPVVGFFTADTAAAWLPSRPHGSLGLVGHSHQAALFTAARETTPEPGVAYDWPDSEACVANPGAVCGNPRDAAAWWLMIDTVARTLTWSRRDG